MSGADFGAAGRAAPASKHLGARELRAIEKIGDRLCPGDAELGSFSRLGCVSEVDRVLDFMPERDVRDLRTLLRVFAMLPAWLVAVAMRLLEWSPAMPGPAGAVARLIRIGLRGLVMTLYYGHPRVLKAIGYEVGVYLEEEKRHTNPPGSGLR